ncbi:hypothetical protein EYD45_04975 [Hyunsoonleella flava]|uniref:Uncharacterized protein n=1 Tax=Hyunsoonleella flava TaxID=2527939 RepID=A0A4Q9FH74_9FLAO|nr:hypothetical protein [Hyunsoonleella flava]TBN05630.1 hypothetical protein EYD45_04975 [Hyunsoonleella flava]
MKKLVFFGMLLFFSFINSQESRCIKSENEVKERILGYWKEKNVETNIFYRFVLKEEEVKIEIIENIDFIEKAENHLPFTSEEIVEINEFDNCFQVGILIKRKYGSVYNSFKFIHENEFKYFEKTFIRINI